MAEGSDSALLTGVRSALGLAIGEALAAAGYRVALQCDPAFSTVAHSAAMRWRRHGRDISVFVLDLTDADGPERLFKDAGGSSPLALVVNDATLFDAEADGKFDAARFDRLLDANLRNPVCVAQALARQMSADAEALIVNIVDQRVMRPPGSVSSYSLSQAAIRAATPTLALALAPRIRVNAIAADGSGGAEEGETGAADVVALILYLARASAVTGQILTASFGDYLFGQDFVKAD